MRGKRGEVMWPRMVANKWLRLKSGGDKFNSDARDTESEAEDDSNGNANVKGSSTPDPDSSRETTPKGWPTLLRGRSDALWTQCVDNHEYRVFVGTWNVAGRTPQEEMDLEEWLNTKEPCDIYVIGFQEIVPLKAGKVFGTEDSRAADKWDSLIRRTLNKSTGGSGTAGTGSILRSASAPPSDFLLLDPQWSNTDGDTVSRNSSLESDKDSLKLDEKMLENAKWSGSGRQRYKRVASKQMVGIFITIWAKSELRRRIRDLKVSCVGCGIMGCLGNKGSVAVSLSINRTSLCFVCTHLASGQKEGDEIRRNSDVAEILRRTHFPRDSSLDLPQNILGHDRIIWFGDMNYRLTLSESEARSLIEKKDWETLQLSDQLKLEKNAGRIFEGWQEGQIDFAPTYKYAADSDQYCGTQNKPGEKRRVPAWCDRILWYGKGLKQVSYARAENRFSDHRPVSAVFAAEIKELSKRKLQKNLSLSLKLLEAEDFLSGQTLKIPSTPQGETPSELPGVKANSIELDLLPILINMDERKNINIESMLNQKPYTWENEYERSGGIIQHQVVV